jgi:MGT family glycosyltransferase
MKPRHIAVFTHMAAGHVYTSVDVCSELIRRGHRVTFPANDFFSSKLREAGVEALELKFPKWSYPTKLLQYGSGDDSSFWRYFGSIDGPMCLINALSIVGELGEFYEANPPDVILHEWFNFAGRLFSKHLRRPAVQLSTHFAHHDSMVRLDGVYTTPQPVLEFSPVLDNFMSAFGFEGTGHIWHAEPLNIFLVPPEFQYDVDSFDSRFKFVGVAFSRRPNATSWRKGADDGRPILLISEGSGSTGDRFLRLCIEAFADSRYHVVFLIGVSNAEVSSVVLPHNFEVKRHTSNREILPFAAVAVSQGGMQTTLECLYHGVPVVAVPSDPFNSEVAFRLTELGVGLHVPERGMTPLALINAVDTASMDDAIRRRVSRMQDDLKRNRGAELAADAIEEFLECGNAAA